MSADADYTSNTLKETFPDGLDTEVFKFKALEEAWKNAKLQSEREHVTPYMRKISNNFKLMNVENFVDISSKRWTLDNTEDYKFISAVYKYFGRSAKFGMQDVLNYLCVNPALEKLNSHITRNEGYLKSIANDKVVK
jgi:spore coat polysaccharide biosynthesis protein SpsF